MQYLFWLIIGIILVLAIILFIHYLKLKEIHEIIETCTSKIIDVMEEKKKTVRAILEKIKNVLSSDEILALKKGKQGRKRVMKETNIKSFIDKYSISIRNDVIVLNIRLLAGPEKNLNPSLLFDTIIRLIDMDFEWKSIARISLLDKDYKEFK